MHVVSSSIVNIVFQRLGRSIILKAPKAAAGYCTGMIEYDVYTLVSRPHAWGWWFVAYQGQMHAWGKLMQIGYVRLLGPLPVCVSPHLHSGPGNDTAAESLSALWIGSAWTLMVDFSVKVSPVQHSPNSGFFSFRS